MALGRLNLDNTDEIYVTSKHRTLTWSVDWSKQDLSSKSKPSSVYLDSGTTLHDLQYDIKAPSKNVSSVYLGRLTGREAKCPGSPSLQHTSNANSNANSPTVAAALDYHPNYDAVFQKLGRCHVDMKRGVGREKEKNKELPPKKALASTGSQGVMTPLTVTTEGGGQQQQQQLGGSTDFAPSPTVATSGTTAASKVRLHSPCLNFSKMSGRSCGPSWISFGLQGTTDLSLNPKFDLVERRVPGGSWSSSARTTDLNLTNLTARKQQVPVSKAEAYDVRYDAVDKHPVKGTVHFDRQPTRDQHYAMLEKRRGLTSNCTYFVPSSFQTKAPGSGAPCGVGLGPTAHSLDVPSLLAYADAQRKRLAAAIQAVDLTEKQMRRLASMKKVKPATASPPLPHTILPRLSDSKVSTESSTSASNMDETLKSYFQKPTKRNADWRTKMRTT